MYEKILTDIKEKMDKIKEQIKKFEKELKVYKDAYEAILKLQARYDKEMGNLAVQKGVCPFPEECNRREYCTTDYCNADACDNGHCYRMS